MTDTLNPDSQHANVDSGAETAADVFGLDALTLPPISETTEYHDDPAEPSPEIDPDEELGLGSQPDDYRGLRDDKGREFDPAIHKAPPEKTPSGIWRKIPKKEREQNAESGEPETQPNASYRIEAQKMASLYAGIHAIPFPENFTPSNDELKMVVDALERYYIENGVTELPAGANLAFSMGLYSYGIATRESNISRVQKIFARGWQIALGLFGIKKREQKVTGKKSFEEGLKSGEQKPAQSSFNNARAGE